MTPWSAPWESLLFCLLLLVAPVVATEWRRSPVRLASLAGAIALSLLTSSGPAAYGLLALTTLIHAADARAASRTGSAWLAATALLLVLSGLALQSNQLAAAFLLSTLTVAVRAGVWPLNAGVASLCERTTFVQTQQLASLIALVFVHLRFVDHHAEAVALAPTVARLGAAAAIIGALLSTVQRDLRGFYRSTTSMHGGLILAALGAASRDNFAAALLVTVAGALSLGGLGIIITSLEERVGAVRFDAPGGRAHAFPRLAAAFALFGAAGVAMPGTVGFVADDLLLHTLWKESPTATVVVILSSAILAVSTLMCYSHVFLGRPASALAPDLTARERVVAVALVVVLLALGAKPGALLGPADAFLSTVPVVSDRTGARP